MKKVLLGLIITLFVASIGFGEVTREGLIGEWLFTGNIKDSSGNENHGKNFNCKPSKDRFGIEKEACDFNGFSAFIKIKKSSIFDLEKGAFTISVWAFCRKGYGSNGDVAFVDKYKSDYDSGFMAKMGSSDGLLALLTTEAGDWEQTFTDDPVTLNTWVHIVYIRDDTGNKSIYVNGKKVSSYKDKSRNINCERNVEFGRAKSYSSYLDGMMDDVRIYKRALTESEVNGLYTEKGWGGQ